MPTIMYDVVLSSTYLHYLPALFFVGLSTYYTRLDQTRSRTEGSALENELLPRDACEEGQRELL